MQLIEYPNIKFLNCWKHPDINEKQRKSLKLYCDSVVDGKIDINYSKKQFGRYYANNTKLLSCIVQNSAVRSLLFGETEYDIDIVQCHLSILLDLSNEFNISNKHLTALCENRENIFNLFVLERQNKIEIIKSLFNIIIYGGGISTWEAEWGLTSNDYVIPFLFVMDFIDEVAYICKKVLEKQKYKDIKKMVYATEVQNEKKRIEYDNENKKDKRKKNIVFDIDKFEINPFKSLAIILQEIESNIIIDAFDILKKENVLITSYIYDGFQVTKQSFNDDILSLLNETIKKEYPSIKFIIKDFKPALDMLLLPEELPVLNIKEFNILDDYDYKKAYFENYAIFCEDPTMWIILNKDGDVISKKTIKDFNNVYGRYELCGSKLPFINVLDTDENKRSVHNFVYKPPPMISNKWDFNSWNGWIIERHACETDACDTEIIYNHIRFMSGKSNTNEVFEYLLNWFAWLVQFPARKTEVCPIFFGLQGTGKSQLSEILMTRIMGKDKTLVTSNCDKIFGKFSDVSGKHLITFNEANGKDTKNIHEIIKDAITREFNLMEIKGLQPIEVDDFANYILTTNNINCVNLPADDRRFLPIEVNNCLKDDVQYFDDLREAFDNNDIIKKFYNELRLRDLSKWNASRDRPWTSLRTEMIELSKDCYVEFYEWIVENQADIPAELISFDELYKKCIKYNGTDLYERFKQFWTQNGKRADCIIGKKTFGVCFKRLDKVSWKRSDGIIYTIYI